MLRVVFIALFAVLCLETALSHATPKPGKKDCTGKMAALRWQPDLSTPTGTIRFALSLLGRHAGLVTANLNFRRNILDVLAPIRQLRAKLGKNAAPDEIAPSQIHQVRYSTTATRYDTERIQRFIKERKQDLKDLPLDRKLDLRAQLIAYKQKAIKDGKFDEKLFRKLVNRLVRVSPIIYDEQGNIKAPPRRKVLAYAESWLNDTTPADLDNLYFDLHPQHHQKIFQSLWSDPQLKLGALKEIYGSIANQVLGRDLKRALTPLKNDGKSADNRVLTLVSVPPEAALYRGCFGRDCSILSVPYYPLIKDVSVHYVFKSADHSGEPDGYVVSAVAKSEGKKLPFVITVNGALSEVDVQAAVRLIADAHQASEILLPDFVLFHPNQHLVNTEEARRGLRVAKSPVVKIKLPPGWEVIDQHLAKVATKYTNYYNSEILKTARRAQVSDLRLNLLTPPRHTMAERPMYEPGTEIQQIPLTQRALFAAQVLEDPGFEHGRISQARLLSELGITEEHIEIAGVIYKLSVEDRLSVAQFQQAQRLLNFDFDDLMQLEPHTRTFSLAELYAEKPDLFSAEQWRKATTETLRALNASVRNTVLSEDELKDFLATKHVLPGPAALDASLPEFLNMLAPEKDRKKAFAWFRHISDRFSPAGSKQFFEAYLKSWEREMDAARAQHPRWPPLFEELTYVSLSPFAPDRMADALTDILRAPPEEAGVFTWPYLRPWIETHLDRLYDRYGHEAFRAALGERVTSSRPERTVDALQSLAAISDLQLSSEERAAVIQIYTESLALANDSSGLRRASSQVLVKDFHPDTIAVMARALPRAEAEEYFNRIRSRHPETISALRTVLKPAAFAEITRRSASRQTLPARELIEELSTSELATLKWDGDRKQLGIEVDRILNHAGTATTSSRMHDAFIYLSKKDLPIPTPWQAAILKSFVGQKAIAIAKNDADPTLRQLALIFLLNRINALPFSARDYDVRSLLLAGRAGHEPPSAPDGIDHLGDALSDKPEWQERVAEYLNDPTPRVRRNALRILNFGPRPAPDVLVTIQGLTQDPYFEIQSVAHDALQKWGR